MVERLVDGAESGSGSLFELGEPRPSNPIDEGEISLVQTTDFDDVQRRLSRVTFRGVSAEDGSPGYPYANATFSLATIYPGRSRELPPRIEVHGKTEHNLWTPQPTIYENQSRIIDRVAGFLSGNGMSVLELSGAVEYHWEGRGNYTILPPIVEMQRLPLDKSGRIMLDKFSEMFDGLYVPDERRQRHHMPDRFLEDFFVDEVSCLDRFDIFNDSLKLLSYGLREDGTWEYYIICDGSHRIDYAIEILGRPISVILAEPQRRESLYPYYAMPMPFIPITRLSSKKAERMHPHLERDKVHTLAELIRKVLHYDWTQGGLNVSSLRSEQK